MLTKHTKKKKKTEFMNGWLVGIIKYVEIRRCAEIYLRMNWGVNSNGKVLAEKVGRLSPVSPNQMSRFGWRDQKQQAAEITYVSISIYR